MELTGNYNFTAPREAVWKACQDPEVLARIMPGCQQLERVGENSYKGRMQINVGPVQGVFDGTVELLDLEAPHGYRMKVSGQGPSGFLSGEGKIRLEEADGETVMHYQGEAQVGGRIASVGQRLMDRTARAITQQSLENLERQIEARLQDGGQRPATDDGRPATEEKMAGTVGEPAQAVAQATGRAEPAAMAEAPGQTEFALKVAKSMVDDLIPEEQQRTVMSALALIGAVIVVRLLADWWAGMVARRVMAMMRNNS